MSKTQLHVRYFGRVVGLNRQHSVSRKSRRPIYPNPAYRAFKKALWLAVREAMGWCSPWPYPLHGQLKLEVRCWIHPKTDPANLLKPIQDVLQEAGAIVNDNQIQDSRAIRAGVSPGGQASRLDLLLQEL